MPKRTSSHGSPSIWNSLPAGPGAVVAIGSAAAAWERRRRLGAPPPRARTAASYESLLFARANSKLPRVASWSGRNKG